MTKNKKILLGVLTILPFAFIFLYLIVFIAMFLLISLSTTSANEANPFVFIGGFSFAFIFIFAAIALSLGLFIYYIIHVTQNKKLDSNDRLLWILVMVFAHQIGYMVYWYLKIWKDDENDDIMINNKL